MPGVGPRRAAAFRRLGIRGVADLILHLPLRYEHEHPEQTIAEARALVGSGAGAEANITVRGEVATVRTVPARRSRIDATLEDDTGTIKLIWFNSPWLRDKLHPGLPIRVWGKVKPYREDLQLVNPRWEALDPDEPPAPRAERYRPVYPGSEEVPSAWIERAVEAVLDPVLETLDDHLHPAYRRASALPTLAEALGLVHRPDDEGDAPRGRRRLAFDELLLLQLGVMLKRHHRRESLRAVALKHNAAIDAHITARFPFELTPGQRSAIDTIAADLRSEQPMNRLLQGDVGAGKTVVALYAMLMAAASGHQAALMAPTEILAEQHQASISDMLSGARVSIELLTGSQRPAEKRAILERLAKGAIDLLIGTHALLTESVSFRSLAVVAGSRISLTANRVALVSTARSTSRIFASPAPARSW